MDELLAEFIAETQETLEALASVVVAWEANPAGHEQLDAIFRFFHTVKGSCGFLELPRFEKLSHAAEDVLSDLRSSGSVPDAATVSAVLTVMDRIAELCVAIQAGEPLPHENDEALIQTLRMCHSQGGAPATVDHDKAVEPQAEEAATAPDGRSKLQGGPRTIRLPVTLIDQLMNGVSDMVLSRNELARKLREHQAEPELEMAFERLSTCVADMRDTISKTRMQRVERLFMAIPRMARDLGRELGKQIDLSIEGGDVEMDREMVEMVVDPLTHIVRNSIDHGIEKPEDRIAAGKNPVGRLSLSARQSGSQIVIEIQDDGKGIDLAAVTRKVLSVGAMTQAEVATLSEAEKAELIFLPGLSTAAEVTAISGRGVGMDVVRANIERLGGTISLDNKPGKGLLISLRVPLTLTIIPGLILTAGGQQFAIPRAAVIEILHDNNPMVQMFGLAGGQVAAVRGQRHSHVDLESAIGLPILPQDGPRALLLVRSSSGVPYVLSVAHVENHEELVIRSAAPVVMASGVYAGMTLPDNGQPMLLLDAGGIAQVAKLPLDQLLGAAPSLVNPVSDAAQTDSYEALQFVEITGEDRLIRLSVVDRVEDIPVSAFSSFGGQHFVQIDGQLLPCASEVSPSENGGDFVTCLRLRDGAREICYPVRAVVDIYQVPSALDASVAYDNVAGITLVEGRQVEVIDCFSVFANCGTMAPEHTRPLCTISDGDDSWNRDILAPLLRQAGYDVSFGEPKEGAIIIQSSGDEGPQYPVEAPIVRLRSASQPDGPEDASVYRYDRSGLISALAAAVATGRKSA